MKPLPWSFSALNTFITCGEMYRRKYITKDTKDEDTEPKTWGLTVHKAFEDRMSLGEKDAPLPLTLMDHEPYMKKIEAYGGIVMTEIQGALDRNLMPVSEWFSKEIWFRVIVDLLSVIRDTSALVVDYKTGKQKIEHEKQTALFAIFAWHLFPNIDIVDTRLYYTQTMSELRKVYSRSQENALWELFVPDLKQYVQAFRTDTFQKRPSGLCRGWCPVKDCQHWSPRRPSWKQ